MIHHSWLPKYSRLIQPLEENSDEDTYTYKQFLDTFVDVARDDLTSNGTIWAMPLYIDTLALYYNKDIFNTAGITFPPKTWEEFVILVTKLTKFDERGNIIQSAVAMGTVKNINRFSFSS